MIEGLRHVNGSATRGDPLMSETDYLPQRNRALVCITLNISLLFEGFP